MTKLSPFFRPLPENHNESTEEHFSNPSSRKGTWIYVVRVLTIFFPMPDNAKKGCQEWKIDDNPSEWLFWFSHFQTNSTVFSPFWSIFSAVLISSHRKIGRRREALGLWRCSPRWWWASTQPEEVSDLDPKESASLVRRHFEHQIDQLAKWNATSPIYFIFWFGPSPDLGHAWTKIRIEDQMWI